MSAQQTYPKDPSAVLDWQFDWSQWLSNGETLASKTITADNGITVGATVLGSSTVTVWLSGGTAGTTYNVACLVTTSGSRTDERTIAIRVQDR